jgi:TRAP-type C4-dicarboxylate transport system substrate-binding protein
MNLNTWNGLSAADRTVLLAEARKAEETWNREYDRMAKEEEAELIKRGMQITEMGADQKAKLPSAWAEAQWELAEKKSGQEVKDLRALLKGKGLTN